MRCVDLRFLIKDTIVILIALDVFQKLMINFASLRITQQYISISEVVLKPFLFFIVAYCVSTVLIRKLLTLKKWNLFILDCILAIFFNLFILFVIRI